jgi:hypothetical protein
MPRYRPATWALIAFCVPIVVWLAAVIIGPSGKDLTTLSPLGWLFDYSYWTIWVRDSLFEILVIVLLALIAVRVWMRP